MKKGMAKRVAAELRVTDGEVSKPEMLRALKKALMAEGHTKARAVQLAKEHYKNYLGQSRGW